jgi:homocysteine S-methyltransferase
MNLDFFKKIRILDGGMGQELLARGMKTKGTLWSANALLEEKYHQLLLDTHLDFIKSGAEVVVTNTFTLRRKRLKDNDIEDQFEYLNTKAGEIAKKTKEIYPHVLIAGGLPPQNNTYEADTRGQDEIREDFFEQAKILNPFVDFFYFDVLSSIKEIDLAIKAIQHFNKPYLIGAHISDGTKLPSGEIISDIITKIKHKDLLGLILSCVSPENYEINLNEMKNLRIPFGFKLNAFVTTISKDGYIAKYTKSNGNPNEFLGQRKDLDPKRMLKFVKRFKDYGATILGGCCETRPSHIKEMSTLK